MKFVIHNESRLLEKKQLTDTSYFFKYSFVKDLEWKPGQYVGITINPTYRRSYSILDYDGENLSFLIDVRPGGIASQYFEKVEIGAINQILGPYGKFGHQPTSLAKIFITTGTGIVPFVPMIKELREKGPAVKMKFFFGARYLKDDIALEYFKDYCDENFEYYQCITREPVRDEHADNIIITNGRVTTVIPELNLDWYNSEFYICGNPAMVEDMEQVLLKKGADKIYLEKY